MSVKEDGAHANICAQNALFQNIKRFMQSGQNSSKAETLDKVLGMVLLRDKESKVTYAFRAQYAAGSTKNEPVVAVLSNFQTEHKTYEMEVRKINPQNASLLEMFCLCCYVADIQKEGYTAEDLFMDLTSMLELQNNILLKSSFEVKLHQKQNWEQVVSEIKDIFLATGKYHSYQCCLRMLDVFDFFYLWNHPEYEEEVDMEEEVRQTLQTWEETAKGCETITLAIKEIMRQDTKMNKNLDTKNLF